MKAQLASADAFKQAGIDYATTLLGIHFSLEKRADGQSVIKLSSDKPVNDPFVDILLELDWPAGRLVREYTFLLDPSESLIKTTPSVVTPALRPDNPIVSKTEGGTQNSGLIDDELRTKATKALSKSRALQAQDPTPQSQTSELHTTREVQRGDTLRKIANETKPEGVSLEQMLIVLQRANRNVFEKGNINRLRAGQILSIPDKSEVKIVPKKEALKIIAAQSSEWNTYRKKLAGIAKEAPTKEAKAQQESSGKITEGVKEAGTSLSEPKNQVKVSKTERSAKKSGKADKNYEEDLIAKDRALKEAHERISILEGNVAKQEVLLKLKDQNLAELQKQAAQQIASANSATQSSPPAPIVEPTSPPETVPVVQETPAKPAQVLVADPASPESKPAEPKPAVSPPKPKPRKLPPPQPPAVETSWFDDVLANPLLLGLGGGGLVALLAAYFVIKRRRAANETEGAFPPDLSSIVLSQNSTLGTHSVFRDAGGQSVDTSAHAISVHTGFGQPGPGNMDADQVDPIAEADVYMAYGRDTQAEEILLEAREKNPKRYAIHLKLLEIYSNRKDLRQFETLASDLYGETSGVGADWAKAAAMGKLLDPSNPLFGGSALADASVQLPSEVNPENTDVATFISPRPMKNTVVLPGELSLLAEEAAAAKPSPTQAPPPPKTDLPDLASLDFDLGVVAHPELAPAPVSTPAKAPMPPSTAKQEASALDFTITTIPPGTQQISSFEQIVADQKEAAKLPEAQPLPAKNDGFEFDVSLTESTFLARSVPEPEPESETPHFDMGSIDLDLAQPRGGATATMPTTAFVAPASSESAFEEVQASTAVNSEFAREQAETMLSPQREPENSPLLPEQNFLDTQSETLLYQPAFAQPQEFMPGHSATPNKPQVGAASASLEPEFGTNEEAETKLDLAKAYEEMNDFEGARELLQEVLAEGSARQREQAQAALAQVTEKATQAVRTKAGG